MRLSLSADPHCPKDPRLFVLNRVTGATRLAENEEMPNFSLMFHAGGNYSTGFIPSSGPGPEAGAWMGISISDRFEGLWGLDYYTMPDMTMQSLNPISAVLCLPSRSNRPPTYLFP